MKISKKRLEELTANRWDLQNSHISSVTMGEVAGMAAEVLALREKGDALFEAADKAHSCRDYYENPPVKLSRTVPPTLMESECLGDTAQAFDLADKYGAVRVMSSDHSQALFLISGGRAPQEGANYIRGGGGVDCETLSHWMEIRGRFDPDRHAEQEAVRQRTGSPPDDIEEFAREFAMEAHGTQKYGDLPYVAHLSAVRQVLRDFDVEPDEDLAVAAWLHDVLEDTHVTQEQLEASFGKYVTSLVWAVTGVGKNRKERNANAYGKMKHGDGSGFYEAIVLKLADRIANCESAAKNQPELLAMYRKEFPEFKARLFPCGRLDMWQRLENVLGDLA